MLDNLLTRQSFERRDQGLITELLYGVIRHRIYLDWQIEQFSSVKKIKRPIRYILQLALYQLLFLDKIPSYAAVNTAVTAAKKRGGIAAGRFVNALLRTLLRQKETLPQPERSDPVSFISIMTSHPAWMVRRWFSRWGEEKTLELCHSNNEIPPMTLRVNLLKTSRMALSRELEVAGGSVLETSLSPVGLLLKGLSIRSLPAFQRGEFYIQDEGAQLISYLVDPKPGEHIFDMCAAPGGKSTHLAEIVQGKAEMTASDFNADRVSLIHENIQRLKTPAINALPYSEATAPDQRYDRILVDAPCSALGILRKIPEGKWRKEASIIALYSQMQLDILQKAVKLLKVGGRLIYATCSTEVEENESVVELFQAAHPEMEIEDPSDGLPAAAKKYVNEKCYFTTLFNSEKMDSFFSVRWRRRF